MALELSWLYSWAGLCLAVPLAIRAAARGWAGWAVAIVGDGVVATLVFLGVGLISALGRLQGLTIMLVDPESVAGPAVREAEGWVWRSAAAKRLAADLELAKTTAMGFVAGPSFGLAFWLGLRLRAPGLFFPDVPNIPDNGGRVE